MLTQDIDRRIRPAPAPRTVDTPPALRLLASLAPLSGAEFELVRQCARRVERVQAGSILHPGGEVATPRLILAGWACRMRTLPDGRRQILGFLMPGDMIGVRPGSRRLDMDAVTAVSRVDSADASPLAVVAEDGTTAYRGLARAIESSGELELARLLDQLVRLGRQNAYERTAGWLLDVHARLDRAGLVEKAGFPLPVTQEVLADALGLSVVHVNRTLQQLRREGLLQLQAGRATLPDRSRLAEIAGRV